MFGQNFYQLKKVTNNREQPLLNNAQHSYLAAHINARKRLNCTRSNLTLLDLIYISLIFKTPPQKSKLSVGKANVYSRNYQNTADAFGPTCY